MTADLAQRVADKFDDALAYIASAENLLRRAAAEMESDGQHASEVKRVDDLRTAIHVVSDTHLRSLAASWDGYAQARESKK